MRLFVFGLGYSAQHFIDRYAERFKAIAGTVRTPENQQALQGSRCTALRFGPDQSDPQIAKQIATADVLLVSVPPGAAGDPALAAFGPQIAASGLKRIVYLSSIGVYADHRGHWIDETATMSGEGRRRLRIDAEAAWLAVPGQRTSVLRIAGIYGPGRNALRNLKAGTARRIVKPGQVFNRIHVEDIARTIDAALDCERVGIWNVCDDEPGPPQDVIAYAAKLMGIALPPDIPFAEAEMSPMARSFYATSNRVSNARWKGELGIRLAYPTYRDGLTTLWLGGEGS